MWLLRPTVNKFPEIRRKLDVKWMAPIHEPTWTNITLKIDLYGCCYLATSSTDIQKLWKSNIDLTDICYWKRIIKSTPLKCKMLWKQSSLYLKQKKKNNSLHRNMSPVCSAQLVLGQQKHKVLKLFRNSSDFSHSKVRNTKTRTPA